jgi:sugar/nucleoside kinase (ribokinase family)
MLVALEDFTVRAGGCAANAAIDLMEQDLSADVAGCIDLDDAGDSLLRTL